MKISTFLAAVFNRKETFLRALVILLISGMFEGLNSISIAAEPQTRKPEVVTDLVVQSGVEENVLFLVDLKTKGIYFYKLPVSSTKQSISLDLFTEIRTEPKVDEPSCIAFYENKLFICEKDEDDASIYQLEVESVDLLAANLNPITKVPGLTKPDILEPKSIAISDKGVIAIGDDKLDNVILFERDLNDPKGFRYQKKQDMRLEGSGRPGPIDEPERIGFIGSHLVVLDVHNGKLSVINGLSSGKIDGTLEILNKLLSVVSQQITSVRDFTVLNGIFYIVDESKITAFAPFTSHRSFPVLAKAENGDHRIQSRVAAGKDYIFVNDSSTKSLLIAPRLIPVNINFELSTGKTGEPTEKVLEDNLVGQRNALVSLYEHLQSNKMLPKREVRTRIDYRNDIRQLLIDEKVLFERPSPAGWFTIRDTKYIDRLERLICELNREEIPALCNKSGTLSGPLTENQRIIVPQGIEFETGLNKSDVSLGDRTVVEHLKRRVVADQFKEITADYLFLINQGRLQSLESKISDLDFIPASRFSPSLGPGKLITFQNGEEKVVGDWSKCIDNFSAELKSSSFDLPSNLATKSGGDVIPTNDDRPANSKILANLGVDNLKVSFGQTKFVGIDVAKLEQARNDSRCAVLQPQETEVFVIDSAIQASDTGLILLRNNSLKTISQKDWETTNFVGQTTVDSKYSVKISHPLFLGYTLRKVDPSQNVLQWTLISDSRKIRSDSNRYIFNLTDMVLSLPATKWRLSLFLNAKDLNQTPSLAELRSTSGVSMFSEEKLISKPLSNPDSMQDGNANENCQDAGTENSKVTKNRCEILSLIKYYKVPEDVRKLITKNIYIGVAETRASTHLDHPDFKEVWYKPSDPSEPFPPWELEIPSPLDAPAPVIIKDDFDKTLEHGIHVAGLIAGRGKALPGLLPGSPLYLIDTSSPALLEKQISIGSTSGLVRVFNFSFTFNEQLSAEELQALGDVEEIKKRIMGPWNNDLFIFAAGNDGENLKGKEIFPIKWSSELNNVIGVGAATPDGNLIPRQWECSPEKVCKGTNFGKTHVDIIAPGQRVFSIVSDGYSQASGTSQAVPLVSAAAAALFAQVKEQNVTTVKARLIYTTDWKSQYSGEVWGGLLNFRRAVMYPHRNILVKRASPNDLYSFKFDDGGTSNPKKITIKNVNVGDHGRCAPYAKKDNFKCEKQIPLSRVMRITRYNGPQNKDFYRIMYLEYVEKVPYLRIIENVQLNDLTIPCEELEKWDEPTQSFIREAACTDLKLTEMLEDYAAAIPTGDIAINF